MNQPELTASERLQIATILSRRANEVAGYSSEHKTKPYNQTDLPASVDYALELEIVRLRKLADKVNPPAPELPIE